VGAKRFRELKAKTIIKLQNKGKVAISKESLEIDSPAFGPPETADCMN